MLSVGFYFALHGPASALLKLKSSWTKQILILFVYSSYSEICGRWFTCIPVTWNFYKTLMGIDLVSFQSIWFTYTIKIPSILNHQNKTVGQTWFFKWTCQRTMKIVASQCLELKKKKKNTNFILLSKITVTKIIILYVLNRYRSFHIPVCQWAALKSKR